MTTMTIIARVMNSRTPLPGPGSYDIPSDFGRAPKYSIKHRYKDRQLEPKPGYQHLGTTIGQGRKFSLSIRPQTRDYTGSPGPEFLPPCFGEGGRKTIFHKRINIEKISYTPGPGSYNIATKLDGKRFSMKARRWTREEGEVLGPGPGSLLPDYKKTMRSATACSIRPKIDELNKDVVPAPGEYVVPRDLDKKTATFHIKKDPPMTETVIGPKYNNLPVFGKDATKHRIRSRINIRMERLDPEILTIKSSIGDARMAILKSRFGDKDYTQAPGPSYVPPPFGSDGRKKIIANEMKKVREIKKEEMHVPGPGAYNPKKPAKSLTFTIRPRTQNLEVDTNLNTPGPGELDPDYSKVMKSPVKAVIREKEKEKKAEPGAPYRVLGSTLSSTVIKIGTREEVPVIDGVH